MRPHNRQKEGFSVGILSVPRREVKSGRRNGLGASLLAIAGCCLWTGAALADEFRAEFPPIFTMSPHGVNIQTGRLHLDETFLKAGPLAYGIGSNSHNYTNVFGWYAKGSEIRIGIFLNGTSSRYPFNYIYGSDANGQNFQDDSPFEFIRLLDSNNQPYFWGWNIKAVGWSLHNSGSVYTLKNANGDQYIFENSALLSSISGFPDQNKILVHVDYADGHREDYIHDAKTRTHVVQSNQGYALVFDYDSGGGLTAVCAYNTTQTYVDANTTCQAAKLKIGMTHDGSSGEAQPATLTDVLGNTRSYQYVNQNGYTLLTCMTYPASSTCAIRNSYDPLPGESPLISRPDQVRQQTTANGDVWTYRYDNGDSPLDVPVEPGQKRPTGGGMTDPLGRLTYVNYINGVVSTVSAPTGTLTYKFNGLTPQQVTYPEGNSVEYTRDNNLNLLSRIEHPKTGPGPQDKVVTQTFPATWAYPTDALCDAASPTWCNKPITRTDERGNETDFTYDPAHGGVLTETGPAVNGVRPQTRYAYVQRYAWIKSSSGGYVHAATPIWLLASKSFCKTGAASGNGCAIAGDEVVTTYDYGPDSGPNNLLLRGTVEDSTGAALRTCYGYDDFGNKVSETKPLAGLTSCP